jgi:hypothetical protein
MRKILLVTLVLLMSVLIISCKSRVTTAQLDKKEQHEVEVLSSSLEKVDSVVYKNKQYEFSFTLPTSWKDYSIVAGKWEGVSLDEQQGTKIIETGPIINIRHPKWTFQKPRQDIPIMIFTLSQWKTMLQEEFHIGAAPFGPSELGRNSRYVFALPARYNYAFPSGYEEVEEILKGNPLQKLDY